MTGDPAAAKKLVELAKEKGLVLAGAPDTFLGSGFQTAGAAIKAGKIGQITGFAITASRNWELLANIFPFLRAKGPGMCYDFGVYHVTALVSLLGGVESVAAFTTKPTAYHYLIPNSPHFGEDLICDNETRVSAAIRLRSGVTGTLMLDGDSVSRDETFFRIYGTRGILELGDPNEFGQPVRILLPPLDPRDSADYETLAPVNCYSDNCRGLGVQETAKAILQGKKSPLDASLPYHVLEVLSAILRSSETGQVIHLESDYSL